MMTKMIQNWREMLKELLMKLKTHLTKQEIKLKQVQKLSETK